jgi:predicted RND superfamily exporter protein
MGMLSKFQPEFVPSMYDPENGRMRIVLRAVERQRAEEKDELIAAVLAETRKEFPDAKATGLFVLLKSLIQSLLSDQVVSFALAACGITLMMAIAFRSVRIGLISIVPNLMPIVLVVGCMGWTGLPINIATAMIASVSMGLTVDSTVHFIAGFRRARARGASIDDALHETHQGVGRALVFANVALIVGFLVLTVSEFIPLAYFGLLVSVAMLGGLLGNLFLLPVLLACVDGRCTPVVSETHTEPATTSADV